jgi:hypothetical protein
MRKRVKLRRPSHTTVVAYLSMFLVISGGAAYAAGHLGKNTVGAKQLKKNAVTTAKIKKEAVTAAKVKKGTLTGTQINASTLGTVPTAQTAQTANSLAAPEAWHEVGAPGQPGFQNSWKNSPAPFTQSAAFYKDAGGVVHLRGTVTGGSAADVFELPPGYRPPAGKGLIIPVFCVGGPCSAQVGNIGIVGGAPLSPSAPAGAITAPSSATTVSLEGVTFRAES